MRITQSEIKTAKQLAAKLQERYGIPSSQLTEEEIRAAWIMRPEYFTTKAVKGVESVYFNTVRKENFEKRIARAEKLFTDSDESVHHI